jgi:hypothetical protein
MSYEIVNSEDVIKLIHSVNEMKSHLQKENEEKLLNEWVNGPVVCKRLKICNRTLFTLRKSGKLKYSQFGRKILYRHSDIEEFIKQNYR